MDPIYKVEAWQLDRRPEGERTKRGYRKMDTKIELHTSDPLEGVKRLQEILEEFTEPERAELYRVGVERKRNPNRILEAEQPQEEERARPRAGDAVEDEPPEQSEPATSEAEDE